MKHLRHYTEQATEKRKEGIQYVSLGAGLVCPKDNAKQLWKELGEITVTGVKKDVEENGAANIMRREYFNHECQITMDTSRAVAALDLYIEVFPDLFNEEAMSAVFSNCFNEAVEQDMF